MFKNLFNGPESPDKNNQDEEQGFTAPSFTNPDERLQADQEAPAESPRQAPPVSTSNPTDSYRADSNRADSYRTDSHSADSYRADSYSANSHSSDSHSADSGNRRSSSRKTQPEKNKALKEHISLRERWRRIGDGISRAWAIAGTVIAVTVLVLAVIGLFSLVKNIRLWTGNMDTPEEAGKTIIQVIDKNDFEGYQKLLAADAVTANDRAVFDALQESLDNPDKTLVSNFILIRLENGKQYLASIYFDNDRGKYVIRSMKEVPVNMQNIFVS